MRGSGGSCLSSMRRGGGGPVCQLREVSGLARGGSKAVGFYRVTGRRGISRHLLRIVYRSAEKIYISQHHSIVARVVLNNAN